ncbi:hypothetical protein EXS72_01625 [Candidatus Pacearchaeota archaeon]|nr:hypothetical protein [Candidatus Pacearchaeota archaeon]
MFSLQDREVNLCSQNLDEKILDQKIKGGIDRKGVRFSQDGTVRFAPKGSYIIGEMPANKLAEDCAMIAQYGVEGAKLMAEASATRINNPITYGWDIKENKSPEPIAPTLTENNGRLHFNQINSEFARDGFAFGLSASSAQKI